MSEQQAEVVRRSGGPLARLGRRIGWALAARLVAAVLQLVVVVLLARGLAPTEFAFVASVNVVLTALVALNGFGLLRRMQLMRARDRDDPGLPGLFALWQRLILGSAGVWLVLCALLGWWDTRFWLIAPFAAWLWFEQTTSVWNGISLADGRPQDLMPSYLWRRAPVALALVWAGGRDVDLVLVWSVASAAGALLAYLTALHRQEPWARVWWPRGRGPGRGAFDLAYWWSAVGVEVRDLDVAVLSWADAGTGALYALPARLIKPMNLVTVATASVVFPVLARRPRVTRAQLLAGCGAGTAPVLVVAGVVALLAGELPRLVGEEYAGAVPALRLLCVAAVITGFGGLVMTFMQTRGEQANRFAGRVVLGIGVAQVVTASVGGLLAGPEGAAVGAILTQGFGASALTVRALRECGGTA